MNHQTAPMTKPALRVSSRGWAFTLVELIVAVAAVALLTVGIGQIFSSVGSLVGSGAAIAESDQFARALESKLRADFKSLERMRSDETFLVIRSRIVGDTDGSGQVNGREKAVYLNNDDQLVDQRAGVAAYAPGSRAITSRLDEIMFIAPADRDTSTSQRLPDVRWQGVQGSRQPNGADYVRVYYGHGLRPPVDTRENPADSAFDAVAAGGNIAPRVWFADGDFGDRSGVNNIFAPAGAPALFNQVQGRNQYAGDWLLLRQPLLLSGGLAAGYAFAALPRPAVDYWTFAPYIRTLEARERSFPAAWTAGPLDDLDNATPTTLAAGTPGPYPRLFAHGRTDICAQSRADVQRWLEGLEPGTTYADLADATAFSSGRPDDQMLAGGGKWDPVVEGDTFPSSDIDAPLWQRIDATSGLSGPEISRDNHRVLMSAIAGGLCRFLAEDDPPAMDRRDALLSGVGAFGFPANPEPTYASLMDTHAVIASRVSNFEIAWSDGKTWLYDAPYDRNGDGDTTDPDDLRRGDLIWYDINFTRYDRPGGRDLRAADRANAYGTANESIATAPEVAPGQRLNRLNTQGTQPARYDPVVTGAEPDPQGDGEYLAIFPFRLSDTAGGYAGPYTKPKQVRVRITVHDEQFRIPGGRSYEFIFSVDLQ